MTDNYDNNNKNINFNQNQLENDDLKIYESSDLSQAIDFKKENTNSEQINNNQFDNTNQNNQYNDNNNANNNYTSQFSNQNQYDQNLVNNYYQQNNDNNSDLIENQYFGIDQQQTSNKTSKVNAFDKIKTFLIKKWWLVLLLLIGISLLFLGIWANITKPQTTNNTNLNNSFTNVKGVINGPSNLSQGTPSEWQIEIENFESVPITNITVELDFDTDFQFLKEVSPSSENANGTLYKIARLDQYGGRVSNTKIIFQGVLIGRTDVETKMNGKITYQAEINGRLSNLLSVNLRESRTKITNPEIDLTMIPTVEEVQNNGQAELTVKIRNTTDKEIKDLQLVIEYPTGQNNFTYTSSSYTFSNITNPVTTPTYGNNTWEVKRIAGGSEHILKVSGKVIGSDNTKLNFKASLSIKANKEYRVIKETLKSITIISQPITISTKIQGKTETSVFIPGETLTFEVTYKNDSNRTINNLILIAGVEDIANLLDFSTLDFNSGERGVKTGNQLTWKSPQLVQLQTIRPNTGATYTFSVKVKEEDKFLNLNLDQTKYVIRSNLSATAQGLEQISISSPFYKAKGKLEFFQDNVVFKGKNITNNKEIYTVTWRIRSWQNEIRDVRLKTISTLDSSSWLDRIVPETSKSNISYNPLNGEIIWNVGTIPSYTGRKVAEIVISFDLEVSKEDSKELTKAPEVVGTDLFTGENYKITGKTTTYRN